MQAGKKMSAWVLGLLSALLGAVFKKSRYEKQPPANKHGKSSDRHHGACKRKGGHLYRVLHTIDSRMAEFKCARCNKTAVKSWKIEREPERR